MACRWTAYICLSVKVSRVCHLVSHSLQQQKVQVIFNRSIGIYACVSSVTRCGACRVSRKIAAYTETYDKDTGLGLSVKP